MKQCSNLSCLCKEPQTLLNFTKNRKNKDGLDPWCKVCRARTHQEWQVKNRDKVNKTAREWCRKNKEKVNDKCKAYYANNSDKIKDYKLRKAFNITLLEYQAISLKQNNACAICKQPETSKDHRGKLRNLAVDHCHKTGKIRGLLCQKHNQMLGLANDDLNILKESIDYLN